jgi:hypothetical protein
VLIRIGCFGLQAGTGCKDVQYPEGELDPRCCLVLHCVRREWGYGAVRVSKCRLIASAVLGAGTAGYRRLRPQPPRTKRKIGPEIASGRPCPCAPSIAQLGSACQFRLTDRAVSVHTDTCMDRDKLSLNLSSDDPAVGLRASLALRRLAERVEANHVGAAREKGWSWQQIGDALGVTRQSVHTKYNKESS